MSKYGIKKRMYNTNRTWSELKTGTSQFRSAQQKVIAYRKKYKETPDKELTIYI